MVFKYMVLENGRECLGFDPEPGEPDEKTGESSGPRELGCKQC